MTNSLVQQIVDLKAEHEKMLAALNLVLDYFSVEPTKKRYIDLISAVTVAKNIAEMGNERRAAGNVDLPDRRGTK